MLPDERNGEDCKGGFALERWGKALRDAIQVAEGFILESTRLLVWLELMFMSCGADQA